MSNLPKELRAFIAVVLGASVFLIWNGLRKDDSTGPLIAASGVVGLLSLLAFVVAIIVRSRRQ